MLCHFNGYRYRYSGRYKWQFYRLKWQLHIKRDFRIRFGQTIFGGFVKAVVPDIHLCDKKVSRGRAPTDEQHNMSPCASVTYMHTHATTTPHDTNIEHHTPTTHRQGWQPNSEPLIWQTKFSRAVFDARDRSKRAGSRSSGVACSDCRAICSRAAAAAATPAKNSVMLTFVTDELLFKSSATTNVAPSTCSPWLLKSRLSTVF